MDNILQDLLQGFDFSVKERKILACLLGNQGMPATSIAKNTGIKRPTVYAILDSLVERGLVLRRKKSSSTYFSAVDAKMFVSVLERRAERKLSDIKDTSGQLVALLSSNRNSKGYDISGFQIDVLESYDAIYHQLLDILTGGNFDAVFNPQIVLQGAGKKIVGDFLRKTSLSKPKIREILISGPEAEWYKRHIHNANHSVKELAGKEKIVSDMILSGGAVIISHYNPPHELAIKISHPDFYTSMQTVFEQLWTRL